MKFFTKLLLSILISAGFFNVAFSQPVITSFSPLSQIPGYTVTITGLGFNTTATNNIVFFGATRATVTDATATSLTVTVPFGATYAPITLLNTGTGLANSSRKKFTPIYSPAKPAITTTNFLPQQNFATVFESIQSVTVGDLDGDGKSDLVALTSGNIISVYRNISTAGKIDASSFAPKVDFTTGNTPHSVAIGDLDGDGKLDLAVANVFSNTVSVFRNTTTMGTIDASSFAPKVDFATGNTPNSVAIGDLDGDGKLDLAVAIYGSMSISIFRNTATTGTITSGSFAANVEFTTASSTAPNFRPFSVAIGDLDGDGKPDLAAATFASSSVSVFRNTSTVGVIDTSSFAAKVDIAAGLPTLNVIIEDIDGDDKLDLAVVGNSNRVSIFRNTATSGTINAASFATKIDFTTTSQTSSIAFGDLEGTGKPELVVFYNDVQNVSVFSNTSVSGIVSFSTRVDIPTTQISKSGVIADLDGDGKSDLVMSFSLPVLRNADIPAPKITSFSPQAAKPGVAVAISGTGFNTTANNNIVFFGATRATVNSATATSLNVTVPTGATYAPISLLNTANGFTGLSKTSFTPIYNPAKTNITASDFLPKQDFATNDRPYSVVIGDLDGDGKPDLVVGRSGSISVFRNISTNGSITSGSFAPKVDFYSGGSNYSVAIGDLDGDGKPEIVATTSASTVSVLHNTSTSGTINSSSFASLVEYPIGLGSSSVAIGDLDGDGKLDLVVTNMGSGNISILHNNSIIGSINSETFKPHVQFAVTGTIHTFTMPTSVAIGDLDGDGKPDLVVAEAFSGEISIFRNTSEPGSIGSNSFVANVVFALGGNLQSVAIGDLDGDGKPDLAVADGVASIAVLYNTATMGSIASTSFAPKIDIATGGNPYSVAIGDLDGDGKPDLIATNPNLNNLAVFRNTSVSGSITSSSFATKVDYPTGLYPIGLAIGDLDGDGKPDLAVANRNSFNFSILRNRDIPTAITSFSPITAKPGDVVTITGTGFNNTTTNNIVFIGATKATVTAASFNSLTVTVPAGASYAPITLVNTVTNLAASSLDNFTPIYSPSKTNITATDLLPKQDFAAAAGANPFSIAIGDLDGDGKPDLAVANISTNKVSIYRNTSTTGAIGTNSYAAKVDFVTGLYPYAVTIGDVDGDGKPDLVVTNTGEYTVSILRNTATIGTITTGSFAAKVDFPTGVTATSVALRDFDGDGKPDLAVANFGSATVSIYQNTAIVGSITTGSFAAKVDFTTNPECRSLAIGDIDGDGKPDLVTANAGSNNISILRNTTTIGAINSSSFAAKVDIATAGHPWFVAIGDLNGDGKPDVAVANSNGNNISIFRNTATTGIINANSFATQIDYATGTTPFSVAIGDIDGDGKPDIAVANSNSNNVSILRNTSAGNTIGLAAKVDLTTGTLPQSVAIGDLDGDGKPDLAIANNSSNTVSVIRNADLPVIITSFTPTTAKPGDVVTITGTGFNTVNANNIVFFGATRAIVTAASATSVTATVPTGATYAPITFLNTSTRLAAYSINNFTPIYSPAKTNITTTDFLPKQDFATNARPYSVVIGDLDGDGKPDLVVAHVGDFSGSANTVSVYRNTSTTGSINSGSFAPKVDFTTGSTPYSLAIGDVDGDGKPDLVVANNGSNSVSILRNTATVGVINVNSFAAKVDFVTGIEPIFVTIADVDADGKLDVAVVNNSSNSVSVFRNTSTSGMIDVNSFSTKVDFATGSRPNGAAFGDLDGDGKIDLAVASTNSNAVSIFRNTSTKGIIDVNSFAGKMDFATEGQPYSVAIGDLDGDGKPDLALACAKFDFLSILRNTSIAGSITATSFAAKQDFATGISPISVAIGDLDGDGKPDLGVTNGHDNTVSIFRNTSVASTISLAARANFATSADPLSLAIGDLDSDGKPDLAVSNMSSATISVFRNADIVTIWDGITWSNGTPSAGVDAIIASNTAPSSFACKTLTINSGVALTTTGITATVNGNIINNGNGLAGSGTLNIAANSSISGNNLPVTGVLTVASGATLTTNHLLTLKSTSITNTAIVGNSAGTIIGNVTVERYIPAGKRSFRFLASPVTTTNFIKGNWQEGVNNTSIDYDNNQNPVANYGTHITGSTTGVNGFDATQTGAASMFAFNNNTQSWASITNTNATNLIAGNAYRILVRGNRSFDLASTSLTNTATTLRATGTLITGAVTFGNVSSSPSALPTLATNASEFSFIGNPYASPIDWNDITKTGLTGYYYIWDPTLATRGAYVSCFTDGTKSNNSSAVTTAIQSGQAFFVQNTSATAARQLQITEANKITGNTNVFRTQASTSTLAIQLYLTSNINSTSQDGATVLFNNTYSNTVNDEDANKFTNLDENIAIQRGTSLMSIERRNMPALTDTVQLKTWQLAQNNYTLKIDASNFEGTTIAYLQDNYLNNETPLNLNGITNVNFTTNAVAASRANNRFTIVFRSNTSLPVAVTNLKAYQKNTGVQVEWKTQNELNLQEYEVEKSTDATNFTKVGTVQTTAATSYNWFDVNANKGNNFYRLKMIEKDGSFKYSTIVNVKIGSIKNVFTVVGNPIKNKTVVLQLENVEKGNYNVLVYNNLGQKITSKAINHLGGSATQTIALDNVLSGTYQLNIVGNKVNETVTIIVD